ncbi:unnamed protein product [Cladocopium goreaui]|uniref:Uncharacterized protein n=1 Tax=Cladocopium goreaui TaxID=2562237 RepID=A0A9P1FR74_9DINO|nr:unnamed protein product [Cladocopium goreaui]
MEVYDAVEVFCGPASLSRCLQLGGCDTASLDIGLWNPWMQKLLLSAIVNSKDGVVVAFGLVCSTFITMSRGSTFRHYFLPEGDPNSLSVSQSNLLAARKGRAGATPKLADTNRDAVGREYPVGFGVRFAESMKHLKKAPDAEDIRSWHVTPIPGLDDLYEEARMYEANKKLTYDGLAAKERLRKLMGKPADPPQRASSVETSMPKATSSGSKPDASKGHPKEAADTEPKKARNLGKGCLGMEMADADHDARMMSSLAAALRRICMLKPASGKLEVSQEIHRRDKYQSHIKEYWVDVQTTGSFDDENEETFVDKTTGQAASFDLGLPATDPCAAARGEDEPEPVDTDHEVDDDMDDGTSSRMSRTRAIENVGTVMSQLLKVQSRMEIARDKLSNIDGKEAQESMAKVEKFRTSLMKLHDELADLKSFYDGHMSDDAFDVIPRLDGGYKAEKAWA